jgi:endonuclease YncB( thermonuclease family)
VLKQPVEIEVYGRDRYKRILAIVRHGATNVNELLVRSGLAWVCRGGRNDAPAALQQQLEAAEQDAQQARRGLWADPKPEPPWVFRRWERLGR